MGARCGHALGAARYWLGPQELVWTVGRPVERSKHISLCSKVSTSILLLLARQLYLWRKQSSQTQRILSRRQHCRSWSSTQSVLKQIFSWPPVFDIQAGMIEHRTGGGSVALANSCRTGFSLIFCCCPQTDILLHSTPSCFLLSRCTHTHTHFTIAWCSVISRLFT